MSNAGYFPCQFTPGLWKHVWRPVTFTLVVDAFGIKFVGDQHANHLKQSLEQDYNVTVDWHGSKYVGISLKWDYEVRTLDISVPGFVAKPLVKIQHPAPAKPQHAPAKAAPINYGAKVQQKHLRTICRRYRQRELEGSRMWRVPSLGTLELQTRQWSRH